MLTVKALNADTSFLITFTPACAPASSSTGQFPGSFTILIDPWLSGPSQILSPKFSISWHKTEPCVSSLADLPEPDMVIISQDKPDHCHEETLRTLPADSRSVILAAPAAAKKIRKWHHFDPKNIHAMKPYSPNDDSRIFRFQIPASSSTGSPGEVTVAYIPAKHDISGLHSAVGITYRAPTSVLSPTKHTYIDLSPSPTKQTFVNLPPSPPDTPHQLPSSPYSMATDTGATDTSADAHLGNPNAKSGKISIPAPLTAPSSPARPSTPPLDRERTLSLIYSPHGVPYSILSSYASFHLVTEAALPLTALVHSIDRVDNPWYLGGNIAAGKPGGSDIAERLMARCWVGAHDEDKDNRGVSVKKLKVSKYEVEEVRKSLGDGTRVVRLGSGEETRVEAEIITRSSYGLVDIVQ